MVSLWFMVLPFLVEKWTLSPHSFWSSFDLRGSLFLLNKRATFSLDRVKSKLIRSAKYFTPWPYLLGDCKNVGTF